jgi:hypothetical protein
MTTLSPYLPPSHLPDPPLDEEIAKTMPNAYTFVLAPLQLGQLPSLGSFVILKKPWDYLGCEFLCLIIGSLTSGTTTTGSSTEASS